MVLRQVFLMVLSVEQKYTVVGAISIAGEDVCSSLGEWSWGIV